MPRPTRRAPATAPKEPFIADLLKRLAPRVGATLYLEPEQQRVGYLQFANGRRCFFRDNRLDLNTLGAVNVTRDKGFCSAILRHFGYRAPDELTFWDTSRFPSAGVQRGVGDALAFARSIGFPVFVKPNDRSQGLAVCKVHTPQELRRAAARVFSVSNVAVVQRACAGRDYRLVVLDGEVISAYERRPLTVTGDGRSAIAELLAAKQQRFRRQGRDTTLRVTPEMRQHLRRSGLTLRSRPKRRTVVPLADVANLSLGGDSRDVTGRVHPYYRKLVRGVARDLNLRFCGVDVITPNIVRPDDRHVILEVNASPGLDHYALKDPARQQALVDGLYLKVLRAIEIGLAGKAGPT